MKKYRKQIILLAFLLSVALTIFLGNRYVSVNKQYQNVKINNVLVLNGEDTEINSMFKVTKWKHSITEDPEDKEYSYDVIKVAINSKKVGKFPIGTTYFINNKNEVTQAAIQDDNQNEASKEENDTLDIGENKRTIKLIMKTISKENPPKMVILTSDKKGSYTKYIYQ
ncbi:hypothetical protein ACWOFR_06125 [Carnobacterium gallinarum]|uniref:hypothetical protein n=1 Tax=Carnobacterium gallinarum TaxID=2749 RepID=UPI000552609E|nr:hypothetical protein [Carnobacterium gallinarum]